MTATNGFSDGKNRTDYFKTKTALSKINDANNFANRTTTNFLNTNYKQTSKGTFENFKKNNLETKEQLFTEAIE